MAALFTRQCGNAVCSWTPKLSIRNLTFSARRCLDEPEQYWRSRNGLPKNPNAYGPLTDNRDFSFADGRPVPLGVGQSKRVLNHRKHAEKILQCVKEMDFAVERHQRMEVEAEQMKQAILNKKLKPKGHLLLKKSTSET